MKLATIRENMDGRKIQLHGIYEFAEGKIRMSIKAGPRCEDTETSGSWCENRTAAKMSGIEAIALSWGRGWDLTWNG